MSMATFLTTSEDADRDADIGRRPDVQRAHDELRSLESGAGSNREPGLDSKTTVQRHSSTSLRNGTEEHWNLVMKKLAPTGYKNSPDWQKKIIERVIKKMTRRTQDLSLSHAANVVDLGAIGLPSETAASLQAEEARIAQTMHDLAFSDSTRPGSGSESHSLITGGAAPLLQKQWAERNNQVHYYIRAIQMEQLQQQDLDADLQQISEAMSRAVRDAQGGDATLGQQRSKISKQLAIMHNRCSHLSVKASRTSSSNATHRLQVDDLRREKQTHRVTMERLRVKAAKMDEDIAFLTQSAHTALDQREKVKGKFMAAQRDMHQEREQKLSAIKDLVQRAKMLDGDWGLRESEIANAEETRRRRSYVAGRQRRSELEMAETRFGFLSNQVKGWDSEFERLQSFTGMSSKFEPGQPHIVDEITSRFLKKEGTHTSILRFLHEQQCEMVALAEEQRHLAQFRDDLFVQLTGTSLDTGRIDHLDKLADKNTTRSMQVEALLDGACKCVHRIVQSMWRDGSIPAELSAECNVASVELWLMALDTRVMQVRETSSMLVGWSSARQHTRHTSIPEIHEILVHQAAQRSQGGGDAEDEEEEEAERLREESKLPFNRIKVDRAVQRQQILSWARSRRR